MNNLVRRVGNRIRQIASPNTPSELSPAMLAAYFKAQGVEPKLFLEIGANDGVDTIRFLEAFPGVEIHCFEPDPRAISAFKRNVRSPRAHLHETAIGSIDGSLAFYQSDGAPPGREHEFPEGWHLSGSIRRPTGHLNTHKWCNFESSLEVPVQRLDTWAASRGIHHVDFIWADVQGAEIDMITGGSVTLQSTTLFYTEYSETELYDGQVGLETMQTLLPNHYLAQQFPHDALFAHR